MSSPDKTGSRTDLNSSQEHLRKRLSRHNSEIAKDGDKTKTKTEPSKTNEKQVTSYINSLHTKHLELKFSKLYSSSRVFYLKSASLKVIYSGDLNSEHLNSKVI